MVPRGVGVDDSVPDLPVLGHQKTTYKQDGSRISRKTGQYSDPRVLVSDVIEVGELKRPGLRVTGIPMDDRPESLPFPITK